MLQISSYQLPLKMSCALLLPCFVNVVSMILLGRKLPVLLNPALMLPLPSNFLQSFQGNFSLSLFWYNSSVLLDIKL